MKKILAIILVVALILPAAAFADIPDISSLTNDELLTLNHEIQLRLFSEKLVNGIQIPAGKYIIGEDIPEGIYRVETADKVLSPMITIYNEGKAKIVGSYLLGDIYGSYEVGKLDLGKDYIIEVDFSPVVFYPYTGLFN